MAFDVDQQKNAALEGQNLVNPFSEMSNDDYVLYRKHLADKKTSFGDALGIAKDTFSTIIEEAGTGLGTAAYMTAQGELGKVAESAKEGMVAGTVGLTDIASKILNPAKAIPTKEEFIGKPTTRLVENTQKEGVTGLTYAWPSEVEDLTNEDDYNRLVESEKQRDADIVNRLYAMEVTMREAAVPEIARGAQYVDPTLIAGMGGALAKTALSTGKTLFTKGAAQTALGSAVGTAGVSTAPSAITQAGLGAIEGTAGAVQGAASLPSRALQGVGQIAESVVPGSGVGAKATALTGAAMSDAGLTAGVMGGAKATEKVAEVVGAAANAARQEASRAGLLEQVALNSAVSPAGRKLAAGLAQLQPVGRAAVDLTKGAVKGAAAGSVVGGALGGLAERNLEGAAAGFGAGGALGGITGAFHSAFDLGKEALGGSTSRTRQQATGDINTFISTRPDIERGAWADTMNKLIAKTGPERAASQLDAMRVAEASGAKIRVATPDEIKQGLAPGWVNVDGLEIVLNPEKIRGDTAAHESAHILFSSAINRAFRPEIETAIYGVADPVTGQIVKAGVFDDIALGRIAEQIRDAYGKNTAAANEFQGFANTLKNSTDAQSLANARSRIADEMAATYTGRMFDRTRAGRFNPDRLPLVYRKVINSIEDGILDKFRSAIFEKGMDLGFDNVAKTFKDKNGKPIRIPELDAIVKKAFAQKLKTVDVENAKPDLIPVKPADRVLWAKSYGGAKGILNDDGTPKSQAQIDAEAAARWQDMTSRLSALPDNEKIGIDFSRDKAGKTVMTAKGQLSPTAINAILDSGALDPSAKAVLVEVLNSMQRADKSTFDTRYYGVYTRGKGGNKMVAGVKSASQNEILPYSVEINSKDGVLIRAVDMSKVRDRLATAMNKPQFKNAYSNPADALKDLRKYMDNLTQINAVDSATLLGGGVKGATKRNLFYDALGFRLRNGETLLNAPDSVINKSQNTIKSYRAERFAKLVDSGNRFAFEEATTYERALRNFQPDAFTPESLPNGEAYTNPDGYRILNKAGSKLFRTYDDTGKLIGIAESKEKAMKKAQDEFAKKAIKEEKNTVKRFQPDDLIEAQSSIKSMLPIDVRADYAKFDESAPILWRGETNFPKVRSIKIVGADSSGKSKSIYPSAAIVLSNGGVFIKRFRVSDHPQVSETAFRQYDLDYRLTRQKGEGEKAFDKRILAAAEIDLINAARFAWENQMQDLRPLVDGDYAQNLKAQKSAESAKDAQIIMRDDTMRFMRDDSARPAKVYRNKFGWTYKDGVLKGEQGQQLGQFDNLDSARFWIRDEYFKTKSPTEMRFQPSSITARDINTIAKEVGGGEVKGGAKKFGAFMREMRDKGITIRDVVKSYGITLSSIQRQELLAQTIKKNWPDAPFEDGVKIRPEDAFATLLGTEEGQSYLNAAEKGEFNEAAVDVMMQKFKSFGFQNKLKEQMKVAAQEFFPKAESIIDAVNNMPSDQFAEFVRSNVRGISYGKIGFWSGQLGRGDIPTFDSRMGKLVYGKEVPVSNKVLMGQKERLPMLGITVPDEYKDFAQTLLHHEVWDRLNKSDTEHAPIKEAMLRFQPDPTSPNILNGSDGSRIIKSNSGKYRVYLAAGALAGVKDTLESAQKLVQANSNK